MKKIMKKALSLMLALVMMLSLAPMTAMADDAYANGATVEFSPRGTSLYGSLTIAGNATVTIKCTNFMGIGQMGSQYNLVVTGSTNNFVVKNVAVQGNVATYNPTDGVASGKVLVGGRYATDSSGTSFEIQNTSTEAIDFTVQMSMPVGTQANPDMIDLEVEDGVATCTKEIVVEPNSEYYILAQAPANGKLGVVGISSSTGAWGYTVVNTYSGETSDAHFSGDSPVVTEEILDVGSYDGVFIIVNPYMSSESATITVTIEFEAKVAGPGESEETAIEDTVGTKEITMAADQAMAYHSYTAAADGVLSVEGVTEDLYIGFSTVNGEYIDEELNKNAVIDGVNQIELKSGQKVVYFIIGSKGSTVSYKVSYENGAKVVIPEPEETDKNYVMGNAVVVGDNNLPADNMLSYTVHEFKPAAIGRYTFTTEDAQIGIVSKNGMWITEKLPDAEEPNQNIVPYSSVTETEIVWDCTDESQAIWIAVMAYGLEANVNVEKETLVIKQIPEISVYASAEPYVYTGETETLTYVNVEATDKVVDKAVYASDGYYHLNSKEGPVLMVNIYDELFSIAKAPETGKVIVSNFGPDGNVISKSNWNEALIAYGLCADPETGLYPLTHQLVYFYQTYGAQQGLYAESGYVGSQFKNGMGADAWLFACMYVPNRADGSIVLPPVAMNPIEKDADGNITNTVAKEEDVKVAIDKAKEEGKDLVFQTTVTGLTITIANEDLANATAMKVDVKVEIKEDVKDETVAKSDKITENNFVMKIEFAHEGKLPAEATIVIPVPAEVAKAYKTLYYYQIMEDGTLKYVCDAPINSDGKAVVTQDHCSDYVLLTEKVDAPLAEEIAAPKTGDSTNYALWLAVLGLGVVAMAGSVVMKKREF